MKKSGSKDHPISKEMVWAGFKRVRKNRGGAGVDEVSLSLFEADLESNLYKLWNRLTSGSYFPPPVLEVSIDKSDGGVRKLGIPTVGDRVAQMVVKNYLEPLLDSQFDGSSYGYRSKKSAHEAVAACRENCYKYAWVIDLDIEGYFDNINHELLLKALRKHTEEKWILMYIERWLKAPILGAEGVQARDKGTPQGGVISPLLANLYLHYTLDKWLRLHYPSICFERFADDIVIHTRSKEESLELLPKVEERLQACGLKAHPAKTRIVNCKPPRGNGDQDHVSFDFLGFTFKPTNSKGRGGVFFTGYNPGISAKSVKRISTQLASMNQAWNSARSLEAIAGMLEPKVRGWMNYYGKFRKWELTRVWTLINNRLILWVRKHYKRVKRSKKQARMFVKRIYRQNPFLFLHWYFTPP